MQKRYAWYIEMLAACVLTAASLGIRYLLDPALGSMQPFAPGFVVVAVTVWFFGWRGALLAALLTYFGAHYLFVEPRHAWSFTRLSDIASFLTNLTSSLIIIFIGYTARRAREVAEQANRSLSVANEQKDRFIAMVSHELRGPLSVIRNAVAALRNPQTTPEQKAQMLSMVDRQSAQMNDIINDLLDISRITRDQIVLNCEAHDLRDCIEEAVARARQAIAAKGQKLEVAASASVPAFVDRTRILQLLGNLLDNASHYCPPNASIQVALRDGDPVVIEVRDSGPGIPGDLLPHLFEPARLARTRTSESGGLGLGLSLCRKLAELHGGSITAQNCADGPGARFILRLPAAPGSPHAARPRAGDSGHTSATVAAPGGG